MEPRRVDSKYVWKIKHNRRILFVAKFFFYDKISLRYGLNDLISFTFQTIYVYHQNNLEKKNKSHFYFM